MGINVLFFIIFFAMGAVLLAVAIAFKNSEIQFLKKCTQATKGEVVGYSITNNSGVHFPVVQYVVDEKAYKQRLKYGWITKKSSSFKDTKTKVENDVQQDNLSISQNSHISTNVLKDKFPIGTQVDVYYNPSKPKKSYVLRFVKSPVVIVFLITGLLLVATSFFGLAALPKNAVVNSDNVSSSQCTASFYR